MSLFNEGRIAGGTVEPSGETTYVLSFWYVPGGWNYDQAQGCRLYFADKERVEALANEYNAPPELAVAYPYKKEEQKCNAPSHE